MTKEELIRNLKYTMKKHKNDKVDTFGTNISLMCKDVLDYLEQQPCEDYVSRQVVIDYIQNSIADLEYKSENVEVINDIKNLPPVTPTIGTCKDCTWWKSENRIVGYCNACKHGHCSGSWDIGIYRKTKNDFYCADFEKRGSENE